MSLLSIVVMFIHQLIDICVSKAVIFPQCVGCLQELLMGIAVQITEEAYSTRNTFSDFHYNKKTKELMSRSVLTHH